MEFNNENSFQSYLPQPRRIQSPDKLSEISPSANNARSMKMLPPPERKTLVARAGEPTRPTCAPPSSRKPNTAGRAASNAGISRQTSFSSSTSSLRPLSASSVRNVSNGSFSSSTGSGSRPPSMQSQRSQTAMAESRIQKPIFPLGRPSSLSKSVVNTCSTKKMAGNRKCMPPFLSNFSQSVQSVSTRESDDTLVNSNSKWASNPIPARSPREVSLSTAMSGLILNPHTPLPTPIVESELPFTPSRIPRHVPSVVFPVETPSPCRSPKKAPHQGFFPTKESNSRFLAWDDKGQFEEMKHTCLVAESNMKAVITENNELKDMIEIHKTRTNECESMQLQLLSGNASLRTELDTTKGKLTASLNDLEDARRKHRFEIEDIKRHHSRELDEVNHNAQEEARNIGRKHSDESTELRRQLENKLEEEKALRLQAVQVLNNEGALAQEKAEVEMDRKDKALRATQADLHQSRSDLLREQSLSNTLRSNLAEAASSAICLEASMRSLRAKIDFLESDNMSQSQAFADLNGRLQDAIQSEMKAKEKLRSEESLRRKLHNQVQELKGNIRVFCRVRPSLGSDPANEAARISFPDGEGDSREVEVLGQEEKSSLGSITTKTNAFAFDRVFTPTSQNADVFDEISQLVQSALDGYNVCIFCYGQTGSGKTFTMSADDGMIPRAVHQIYNTAQSLEEKGWKYSMEGSFVEVYNENLNDLLGKSEEFDKKKHEIRHDMQKCKTTITDITTVNLDTPTKVESILQRATANRSVAATNANERSSRSHSVFILKLTGENSVTGEKSEGTLNLVDLAGSERLSHSKSTGDRLKETQNINRSLSCLGDVIGALGQGKEGGHVPYRNSKLTYLLQFSLGGNSKTLMFVMISPLQGHLSETLTSLKFATKVHNTHIGTARRQAKVRDS